MSRRLHPSDAFNLIAPAYDTINDVFTLGLHRFWRSSFCSYIQKNTPKKGKILDIATGTGCIPLSLIQKRPDLNIFGIDSASRMIEKAIEKQKRQGLFCEDHVHFLCAQAHSLPFESSYFDSVTICYASRHLLPLSSLFQEVLRVLKPGGRLFILESGKPEFLFLKQIKKNYTSKIPLIGDRFLSEVLPVESENAFPIGASFVAEMFDAGFSKAHYSILTGGMMFLYSAQKAVSW